MKYFIHTQVVSIPFSSTALATCIRGMVGNVFRGKFVLDRWVPRAIAEPFERLNRNFEMGNSC